MSSLYAEATVMRMANDLIAYAREVGVVITIDLKPGRPLAMGNYEMVPLTRQARERAVPMKERPAQCKVWLGLSGAILRDHYCNGTGNCRGCETYNLRQAVQRLPADDTEGGAA